MRKYLVFVCILALLLFACGAKEQKTADPVQTEPAQTAPDIAAAVFEDISETEDGADDLDEYTGFYGNRGYDTVEIEKDGEDYTMSVSLYRLTSLDGGTVSVSDEGVVFDTVDAAGNPMTLMFCQDGETYSLRVYRSTWPLLEEGQCRGSA